MTDGSSVNINTIYLLYLIRFQTETINIIKNGDNMNTNLIKRDLTWPKFVQTLALSI